VQQLRACPELIVVRGVLGRRYGAQSLRTVLDEQSQVYVENARAGWNALLLRRGRRGFEVLPTASSKRNIQQSTTSRAIRR
jgi:hypothetical protein